MKRFVIYFEKDLKNFNTKFQHQIQAITLKIASYKSKSIGFF
jgi:hypothetical protein